MKFLSNLRKNRGLFLLLSRSLLFALIVFGVYFAIFLWVRHWSVFDLVRIGDQYYFSWLTGLRKTDFLNAAVFSVIAFAIWNRASLSKVPVFVRSWSFTAVFAFLSLFFLVSHYAFKFWIAQSQPGAVLLVTVLKYSLVVLFVLFCALAVLTKDFLLWLAKNFWRSLLVFAGIGVAYFFVIQVFQLIWYNLSYLVGSVVAFLLRLSMDPVFYSPGNELTGPRLGVPGFLVGISNECSGVDSLLLFLSLYTLLLVLDWRRMHVKRMLILLIPGIIGTVAYNMLRIYALMLVGIYIDPDFAVDMFHTNAGWILFLLFFIVFWHFGSKWVYKPKSRSVGRVGRVARSKKQSPKA